jgi:phage I-like protein
LLSELQQAIIDRDQLIAALEKLQTRLNEMHTLTEAVTAERDNLTGMYAQVLSKRLFQGQSRITKCP